MVTRPALCDFANTAGCYSPAEAMGRGKMKYLLAAVLCLWSGMAIAAPIKVMLLDGASAAAYHDWKLTSQIMKRELDETGLFDVTVVSAPPADGDFSAFHPDFAKFQVVVSNYDS